MNILNEAEVRSLKVKQSGAKSNPIFAVLRTLEIGEGIIVKNEEWKPKTAPSIIINGSFRGQKRFSVKSLVDESGWLVVRKENRISE